jgi:hypothetical protein
MPSCSEHCEVQSSDGAVDSHFGVKMEDARSDVAIGRVRDSEPQVP